MGVAWYLINPLLRHAARSYLAGPRLDDAICASRAVEGQGIVTFLDYWNPIDEPGEAVADAYVAMVDAIGDNRLDAYVSIKVPPLGFCRERLQRIAEAAHRRSVALHFDAMWPETAGRTLQVIDDLRSLHDDIGFTIPGRWRRSLADADWAAARGLMVRAVKGRWRDGEGAETLTPRESFLQLIDRLAGRVPRVAVATHDAPLAAEALARLRRAGTPAELELALGLPLGESLAMAEEAAVPVRLCIPYGYAWTPYQSGALRREPRLLGRLLKDQWSATRTLLSGRGAAHPRLPRGRLAIG